MFDFTLKRFSISKASVLYRTSFITAGISLVLIPIKTVDAIASTPTRPYNSFDSYSTLNPNSGSATDIYFPTLEDGTAVNDLPAVLLLQGALVDKDFYADYASQVARYGFAVSVPNHTQFVPGFGDVLAPDTSSVQAGLDQFIFESNSATSPLNGKIDTEKFGLLGHSLGGAVGLSVISETCLPGFCPAPFVRPEALLGGAFFGANLRDANDTFFPLDNEGIGVALIQGNQDGVALPVNAERTFEQIQTPPKALITLDGVNHFGITSVNMPDGARPDFSPQTVSQQASIETIARWSGLFLSGTVQGDSAALDYIFGPGAALDPIVASVEGQLEKDNVQSVPEPFSLAGVFVGLAGLLCLKKQSLS